jgi:alpha-amylase
LENGRHFFAFGVHDHQPVGNFPEVFARVHERAYAPFLETARRHPGIRFSLHFSGALLEWWEAEAPGAVEAIRDMVDRGQCEILAGTYYEALAPVAPAVDVVNSVVAYRDKLEDVFGYRPGGMWVAERVFEPHLPALLARAGIAHVALDDWHFRVAGIKPEELGRPWLAEHQGEAVAVCPISQRMRYLVPFAHVEEVIALLRENHEAGAPMTCMADDGEKFGEWPGTNNRCYREGWLEDFFSALDDNADWLTVGSLGEAVKSITAAGPAYLPATSYYEMTRWALPTESRSRLERLGENFAVDGPEGDLTAGGQFRGFLAKYPEVNLFHKRVQWLSARLAEGREAYHEEAATVERHLWRAEANDAYWHGVFGGLYLPHLRRRIREEFTRAEDLLDRAAGTTAEEEVGDVDADGGTEIILKNADVVAVLKEREGLAAAEFGRRSPPVVLTDVVARRPEPYHEGLAAACNADPEDSAETIHTPRGSKEADLARYLVYDRRPKRLFLDRLFAAGADLGSYGREEAAESGKFVWENAKKEGRNWVISGHVTTAGGGVVNLEKTLSLDGAGLGCRFKIENQSAENLYYGLELTLSIISEDPEHSIITGDGEYGCRDAFETPPETSWIIRDRLAGWDLRIEAEPALTLWHAPLYTVSCSEGGFEKIYQGSSLMLGREFKADDKLAGRVKIGLI